MKLLFAWDDGAVEDLKLFNLHKKYDIPGIFFVPSFNCEGRDVLSKNDISINSSDLIMFGGHTKTHSYLTGININSVESEIVENKKYLEEATNKKIEHFCLPGGKYNSAILKIVKRHFRTCRTADTMNTFNRRFLIKPTIHFYNRGNKSLLLNAIRNFNFSGAYFVFKNRKADYFTLIRKYIDFESKKNKTIIVWGHSWEIELFNLWEELNDFFKYVNEKYKECICTFDALLK